MPDQRNGELSSIVLELLNYATAHPCTDLKFPDDPGISSQFPGNRYLKYSAHVTRDSNGGRRLFKPRPAYVAH